MTENAERMLRPIPGTKIRGPRDTSGTIIKAERDGDDIWIEWDKESDSPDSLIFNEWFTVRFIELDQALGGASRHEKWRAKSYWRISRRY